MKNIYAFFCKNYGNITYNELMKMGYDEFNAKLNYVAEDEPLFTIFKSRGINISKIKDKEEKKYWRELKRLNAVPDIFKSNDELDYKLKLNMEDLGGITNAK